MNDLITVKIDDRDVRDTLKFIADRVQDLRPIMRVLSFDMLDAVHENFARGGRPNPWKKSRRAAKKGGKTLLDTTRLYKSITPASDANRAMVGTNVKYAAAHQFGFKGRITARVSAHRRKQSSRDQKQGKRKTASGVSFVRAHTRTINQNIPERPFLVLADDDTRNMVKKMQSYIFKNL